MGSANNEGRRYPLVGDRLNAGLPQYVGAFRMYVSDTASDYYVSRGACLLI